MSRPPISAGSSREVPPSLALRATRPRSSPVAASGLMRALATAAAIVALVGVADAGKTKKKKKPKPTTGTITGVISFDGTPPKFTPADKTSDPKCPAGDLPQDHVAVDADGHLQGAYVVLSRADGKPMPAAAVPADPLVITQDGCRYAPRVSAMITGQQVEIRNDDPTFHNVRAVRGSKVAFNLAQLAGGDPVVRDDLGDAGMVELKCDVHPWMHAYVMVSDHAYFAITDAHGKYTFKDVPPGSYEIHAWYPELDRAPAKKVKVKKGKTVKASLSLDLDDCGGC